MKNGWESLNEIVDSFNDSIQHMIMHNSGGNSSRKEEETSRIITDSNQFGMFDFLWNKVSRRSFNSEEPFERSGGGVDTKTKNEYSILDNGQVLKKYGLKSNSRELSSISGGEVRSVHTENNVQPIDFSGGDFELLHRLSTLLSHSSTKREEIIRSELNIMLQENPYFLKDLMDIYSEFSDVSLDDFVETVIDKLFEHGVEREKSKKKSFNLLQFHNQNRNIDVPRSSNLNSTHLSYFTERKYEFSKQVMKVFDSTTDRKIFNENPMGLTYLDPSIEPYHPLTFNNVVFNLDNQHEEQTTKKKNQTELPIIPKRRRTRRKT